VIAAVPLASLTSLSDHPANIRIKSASIAREHAVIQVDEDHNVTLSFFLEDLSLLRSLSLCLSCLFSALFFTFPPPILPRSMEFDAARKLCSFTMKM
jgi:hypothetical protein